MLDVFLHIIDLVLETLHLTIISSLVLTLPDLGHCDPFIDLVEYFVAALLLVEACFHVLESFTQLVVE